MLLKCCLIHISIIILRHFLYIYYICVHVQTFYLGFRSIYLVSVWSVFYFPLPMFSWKQTLLFFWLFLECVPFFLDDSLHEEWIIFKQQKFSLRVLLSICLIFCRYQSSVAYKSVAYRKKVDLNQQFFDFLVLQTSRCLFIGLLVYFASICFCSILFY